MDLLQVCESNWFKFAFVIEDQLSPITPEALAQLLLDFSGQIPFMGLSNEIESKIEYSRQAYLQQTRKRNHEEQAELGLIVSDNSSDEEQSNDAVIDNVFSKEDIEAKNERQKIKRRARYALKKKVAEEKLLRRRTSRKVSRVLAECPDIGEVIEHFVKESGSGTDKWRRTGVMTSDGNVKVNKKVTFEHIREHLQDHYKTRFSYGTVVQLSIARNKRRLSAKRYKGVAKITSRRARKGFNIKYNPDSKWSHFFYLGLDMLQYTDGSNFMNLNRDDAAGFRLNTMSTCSQHSTISVDAGPLTTRTDYRPKEACVIHVTTYNFSDTKTTGEICASVVKAVQFT